MAFSPCPKCQTKDQFDYLFERYSDHTAMEKAGFVVQRAPSRDGGPEFFCNRIEQHNWVNSTDLISELHRAGYWSNEPVSIEESIESMKQIVARSSMLWLNVNTYILRVLQSGMSREDMVSVLRQSAGPEKKDEPVSIGNLRTAADQLECGEKVVVL